MRAALGPGFVDDFVGALAGLGVDVVVLPGLSTAYSFVLAGRAVIAIPALPHWYRSNWNLAHELAHLALGHEGAVPANSQIEWLERDANAFAAELLMPEDKIREVPWDQLSLPELAQFIWRSGVSVPALRIRLKHLRVSPNPAVAQALEGTTGELLRSHLSEGGTLIAKRSVASSARHFPRWLIAAHQDQVEQQRLGPGTLAWMLDVSEASLEPEGLEAPVERPSKDPLDDLF